MSVPPRSDEQRSAALASALAARLERARLRTDLKSRHLTGADVVEGASDNRVWAGLRVAWLLESLPGIGAVRAERMMSALQIAPTRRIQGLGHRQRVALIAELRREGR
ncbi:MAG: hypothetical protein QG661_69 [Actinomycetota bacterium]|jgi:hypothetical protein|nr:hypothetical protein [Actinomycetota bacterium]